MIKYHVTRNDKPIAHFYSWDDANKFVFADAIYDNYEFWQEQSSAMSEIYIFYNEHQELRQYRIMEVFV